jgi:hypothetical protein
LCTGWRAPIAPVDAGRFAALAVDARRIADIAADLVISRLLAARRGLF